MPTSAIAEIVEALNPRLYIDFVRYLPPEVCLKILEYLDPTSLINVARSCRSWYTLALDKNLWRRLYHLEGWSVVPSEIQRWQDRVNRMHNTQGTSEEQPLSRKRAISDGSDVDCEMLDADRPHKHPELGFLEGTAFKNPTWSFSSTVSSGVPPHQPSPSSGDAAAAGWTKKERGSRSPSDVPARMLSESLGEDQRVLRLLETVPPREVDSPSPSTLWNWDPSHRKYVINWKYLYSMRRKLESNWELGRFSNFQFPHPNHPEEGHTECVYSLQFTPDYLVSGSRDRTIRVWSMYTRRLLLPPLRAHDGSVLCLQFDPDPEEDLIVSGSSDSDVILWRFSTGKIIQRLHEAHRESVLNVRFDKRILVTCSKDRSIKIYNRRPLRYGDMGYPESQVVHAVPINVKGYGEPSLADELPVIAPYTMIGALHGHNAAVNAVQICGGEIVSASGDKAIKVWDWPKQKCSRTILGHIKGIACVQYDGRRIVSGSSDNEVKVFDRSTGLEVASLRAHTNLVRTVQAGFGDLPDSEEVDREAARQVDEEYFKALETGILSNSAYTTSHSKRRGNAGSRRPQDITAYGANLPPGGGGGKFARIVSGSYDQSVIIWRRDKEGLWKDIHHLQQDKAAAAAQRQTASTQSRYLPSSMQQASGGPPAPYNTQTRIAHPSFLLTPEQVRAAIDSTVPRGVGALNDALTMCPAILTQQSHLQAAIDRESSPHARNEMRQAVQAAVERINAHGGASYLSSLGAGSSGTSLNPVGSVPAWVGPQGHGSQRTTGSASTGQVVDGAAWQGQGAQSVTDNTQNAQAAQNAQAQPPNAPNPHLNQNAPNPQHAQQPASNAANQAQAQAHHPHIATDSSPARVFKLQFDARRIICCCQTPVIVGWDFCQGDAELEAVSRFFGTIT